MKQGAPSLYRPGNGLSLLLLFLLMGELWEMPKKIENIATITLIYIFDVRL